MPPLAAAHLAPLFGSLLDSLRSIVGADFVRDDADSLAQYGRDRTKNWDPAPCAVVLPADTAQVQAVVRWAYENSVAIVPSGGRTGLSGGAVASQRELVLSLERLRQIGDFDPVERSVTVGAGVLTAQLQAWAAEQGLFYPVDFASAGSSQIGGNIATNAGGIKVIRWGMTRNWVRGLKVITGTGELLDLNQGLLKNNAGYDLRHLMIGSEGTLGVIVEATMGLITPPRQLTALLLAAPSMDAVMQLLHAFQNQLELTAFEFFSEAALGKVLARSGLTRPLATQAEFYALLEFDNTNEALEAQALQVFEQAVEAGWALDGTMSQSEDQRLKLWRLREEISETIAPSSPYKNDIAVRVAQIPAFLHEISSLVEQNYPDFEIIWFGHIGDGNLHLNILKPDSLSQADFYARCHGVSQLVFAVVQRYGGTVSAEHGVGLLKKDYLPYSRSAAEIALMQAIKRSFDPKGILNPGKIFD
jgi:FAD/FMN-containing dehydrogenase